MKYFIQFLLPLFIQIHLNAQDSIVKDSIVNNVIKYHFSPFKKGDTLVNLNSLNGGIVKFQVSAEDTMSAYTNGLIIRNPGIIAIENTEKFLASKNTRFEVKTFAKDDEWYINTIEIKMNGIAPIVYVSSDKIEMATGWRKEGKIFVVIAVAFILFATILLYLLSLDRKTKALKQKAGI